MTLSNAKYVLFREDSTAHDEIYFNGFTEMGVAHTRDVSEAPGFATAREAYRFGELAKPRLDWWRVGLRS